MMLVLAAFMLSLAGATLAEDKKEDKKAESETHSLEDLYKRFAEQEVVNKEVSKRSAEPEVVNKELRKEVSALRSDNIELRRADAERRKEVSNLKTDNIESIVKLRRAEANLRLEDAGLRKADAELRRADAEFRKEDANILAAKEKTAAAAAAKEKSASKRQDIAKTQDDVEGATRALIRQEINKYDRALNESKELKKVIRSKDKDYFASGGWLVRRQIVIGNGKAKWDSDACGSGYCHPYTVDQAFSTSPGTGDYGCAGWSASAGYWKKPFPVMIWYEFASTHVPARFSFRQVMDSAGPKEWYFVGSKDENCSHGSTWKTLCGRNKLPVEGEIGICDVPKFLREPFKCLGISVYSNNFYDNYGDDATTTVCLKRMKFWEPIASV